MLLTVDDFIKLLRLEVNIQQESDDVVDPEYLAMTDEDLALFIKLAVSRAYPEVTSLTDLPDGAEYPIILLAKIELYTKLAVARADRVDLGADNNNYIKKSQRFDHYMDLIGSARGQYESWLENEGQSEISSSILLLDKRHYSVTNYERQWKPKVKVYIDSVASDSVDLHWGVTNFVHFGRLKVYISEKPVIDMFLDGSTYKDKIAEGAKLVLSTGDLRYNYKRISDLTAETTYYVAVISIERNQVWGYSEVSFDTLSPLEDEEDFGTGDDTPDTPPDTPPDDESGDSGSDSPDKPGEEGGGSGGNEGGTGGTVTDVEIDNP